MKSKTKQNRTRNREQGIIHEKIWHCLMQERKKMISERFEGRAILAARITSEFKMAVMLSSNTLLTCSVIVLLRRIDFTSSRLFIWPAMSDLKLAWTVGGRGRERKYWALFAKITPVLEANALWTILDYLIFFLFYRVIRAKFPEEHRLFTDENSSVHCLAVLNRDYPDMFVLLYVDKNNDSAVSIVIYSFSQA